MSIALLPIVLALTPVGVEPSPPTSVAEAWSRLGACERAPDSPERAWEQAMACDAAAKDVLRLGDEVDRDRLWDRFEREQDGPFRGRLFRTLLDSHVAESVRSLAGKTPASPLAVAEGELPEGLESASPELQDAVRFYLGLSGRLWPESTAPEEEQIVYGTSEGRGAFEKVAGDFLRGRSEASDMRAALARYVYGRGCGNGAADFVETHASLRLVASIREGRIDGDAAVAYVLGGASGQDHDDGVDRDVLRAAGVDWERLYVGAAFSEQQEAVATLVRNGSDRSARLLLEIADLQPSDAPAVPGRGAMLTSRMAGFVESEGPCEGYEDVSWGDVGRAEDAPPIGLDVQQSILQALEGAVQPGAGLDAAQAAAHALVRLCRPESAPAFASMLRSPYSQVRARGAIGLRALGETVADPVPSPPVAFRVIVDGRPWASPVEWELEGSQKFESGTGSPDRDGVVRLDRDPFLDPTAPVESIRLSASDFEEPGGTWFTFLVKPPSDLDVRTLLDVRTGSLTVVVPSLVAAAPGQGTAILMVTAPQPDGDEETILTIPDAHAGRYHFEHLQHGTYVARVLLGGAVLASPEVEVGTRPQTVELTPEPGPDPAVEDDSTGEHDTPRP